MIKKNCRLHSGRLLLLETVLVRLAFRVFFKPKKDIRLYWVPFIGRCSATFQIGLSSAPPSIQIVDPVLAISALKMPSEPRLH